MNSTIKRRWIKVGGVYFKNNALPPILNAWVFITDNFAIIDMETDQIQTWYNIDLIESLQNVESGKNDGPNRKLKISVFDD